MRVKKLLAMDLAELSLASEYGYRAALHPKRCY